MGLIQLDDTLPLQRDHLDGEPLTKDEQYPAWDPAVAYHPLEPLYAELFTTCGRILRMRAYARDLDSFVTEWLDHPAVHGCEPCDRTTAFLATIHTRLQQNPGSTIGSLAEAARLEVSDAEELATWFLAVEAERLAEAR